MKLTKRLADVNLGMLLLVLAPLAASAQGPIVRFGAQVPDGVDIIYERGLVYLAQSQAKNGSWATRSGGRSGSGGAVPGLCVMAFLSSGEDPNFGRYSDTIRSALRYMIRSQNPTTGYFPSSMYNHGFAMLALAEAYGAVDDSTLWDSATPPAESRSIAQALELAVRCAVTSQKNNPWKAWRYAPNTRSADTSVSGAVLMGLLAARNAGIEIPDRSIDDALGYYRLSTSSAGQVMYSAGMGSMSGSMNTSSIGTLVYAIGKKTDWPQYKATRTFISKGLDHEEQQYPFYFRYYMAQALFQSDFEAWTTWNRDLIDTLRDLQQADGSFKSQHGSAYGTAMSLLALALNYRFLPIYER